MAGHAYPHIIFATDDTVLTQETLGELVTTALGGGTVTPGAINVVVDLDGYALTFWVDDDAEGLAERYADFLPETARRRRLVSCTTMIDASADADPDRSHAADLDRVFDALAATEGVWVFSEAAKRFVGLDYGDGIPEPQIDLAPAASSAPEPLAVPQTPAAEAETAVPRDVPAQAPATGTPAPPMPRVEPSSPAPAPMPTAEPSTPAPAPMPTPPVEPDASAAPPATPTPVPTETPARPAEDKPAAVTSPGPQTPPADDGGAIEPTESDADAPGKQGIFKRLFGRRR